MNWIDITFLLVAAYLIITGFISGLIKSVFGYLSIIAGLVVAICWNEPLRIYLENLGWELNGFFVKAIAVTAVFAGTFLLVQGIGYLLKKLISPTPLGFFDRGLGAAFGAVKSLLIGLLTAFLLSKVPSSDSFEKVANNSKFLSFFIAVLPSVQEIMEENKHRYKAIIEVNPAPEEPI